MDDKIIIVVDAMMERGYSQKNTRMGWQGCWRIGESSEKQCPFLREAVDIRSLNMSVVITAQPVRPERIDGDKKEIETRLLFYALIKRKRGYQKKAEQKA
jgi:hypothetical protein